MGFIQTDTNTTYTAGTGLTLTGTVFSVADDGLTIAKTDGLQAALNGKQATIDADARISAELIHDGSISDAEFGHLNGVTSGIQAQLDAKPNANLTQAEITAMGFVKNPVVAVDPANIAATHIGQITIFPAGLGGVAYIALTTAAGIWTSNTGNGGWKQITI